MKETNYFLAMGMCSSPTFTAVWAGISFLTGIGVRKILTSLDFL